MAWPPCALAVLLLVLAGPISTAAGAKRHAIPDDLRDVVDDEEDEDWRHWGAPAAKRDPPPDLSRMDPAALRAELLRGQTGPSLGFVKLRLGVRRSQEDVMRIATRWSSVLRTGSVAAKFVGVDFGTLMFTMERGRDIIEVRATLLCILCYAPCLISISFHLTTPTSHVRSKFINQFKKLLCKFY
jgi:hypothetical protein